MDELGYNVGVVKKTTRKAEPTTFTSSSRNFSLPHPSETSQTIGTYRITLPAMKVADLRKRLHESLNVLVEVEDVTPNQAEVKNVAPDRNKVVIRQGSEVEVAALEASNLGQAFLVRKSLLANARPVDQVRELLGVKSPQTLHNWIKQGKVIALTDNGRVFLPLWQFDATADDKIVAGLSKALTALKRESFSAALWFTIPNPALGNRSPIALLKAGKIDDVVSEAELADVIS